HDLNQAARYADHIIAMKAGEIVASGPPQAVIAETLIETVFGMRAMIVPDPVTATPMVIPIAAMPADSHG
ncbi:cobalamin/Fe(3+)-siderophore ABC transporter ATP-binding protein, partial [Pseudoxanthomonas sp. KAs_5_3]